MGPFGWTSGGWYPPPAPTAPVVARSFSILSSAGVWWDVPRSGLVSWLSQRDTGASPTWRSVGASPAAESYVTAGWRPEDWASDERATVLADLRAGRAPSLPQVRS